MATQDKDDSQKLTRTSRQEIFLTYLGNVDFTNISPQTIAALEQGVQNLDASLSSRYEIRKQMPKVAVNNMLIGNPPQDAVLAQKVSEALQKSESSLQKTEEKVQTRSNKI